MKNILATWVELQPLPYKLYLAASNLYTPPKHPTGVIETMLTNWEEKKNPTQQQTNSRKNKQKQKGVQTKHA